MNDQPSSKATNAHPMAARPSNVLNEGNWSVVQCPSVADPAALGFLQLCADRRFHRCIQARFQEDAGLRSAEDYWIHADAGGTPKMASQIAAPNYCYYVKRVRLMGWAAHGDGCGGWWPNEPDDDEIRRALYETVAGKLEDYPEARHFIYFATTNKEGDAEETVVYCMVYEKGAD